MLVPARSTIGEAGASLAAYPDRQEVPLSKRQTHSWPQTAFWRAYQGAFTGILKWEDMDALWEVLARAPDGWHVFDPEQEAPGAPLEAGDFVAFLEEARGLLETRRDLEHCGAAYVDDRMAPSFVKVFDPTGMGSSCSISGAPILPRWIVTQMAPDSLPKGADKPRKPGLLGRLTGRRASTV